MYIKSEKKCVKYYETHVSCVVSLSYIKGIVRQKICHNLLTFKLFQDNLNNVGNQTVAGSHDFQKILWKSMAYQQILTFFKISSFEFSRRKKFLHV